MRRKKISVKKLYRKKGITRASGDLRKKITIPSKRTYMIDFKVKSQ
jgi:hypothetical protein